MKHQQGSDDAYIDGCVWRRMGEFLCACPSCTDQHQSSVHAEVPTSQSRMPMASGRFRALPPGRTQQRRARHTITDQAASNVLAVHAAPLSPTILVRVLMAAATAAWATSAAIGSTSTFDVGTRRLAVSAHVLALVLAFGAVVVVDWVGFLWLVDRRGLHETTTLERAVSPLIWTGLAGMLITGALIHPDLTNPATQLKMCCVLGLMLNGIALIPVTRRIHALPDGTRFKDLGGTLRTRMLSALVLSQVFWWTAIIIGFANSIGRQ